MCAAGGAGFTVHVSSYDLLLGNEALVLKEPAGAARLPSPWEARGESES